MGRPTSGELIERKLEDGRWSFAIRWQADGDRRQRTVVRAKDRKVGRRIAEQKLAEMRQLWESGTYQEALETQRTWTEASAEFLAWCRHHLEASSTKRYRAVMQNFLAAKIHPELLVDTRGEVFERYKAHLLSSNRAPSGINYEIATLKRFWSWCQGAPRKWVGHDPFEGVASLRTERGADTAPRIFTPEECAAIRERSPQYVADFFTFAVHTGLRLGELIHLDPDDIDDGSVYVRAKPGHRTKTHERRAVPLTATAWGIAMSNIDEGGPIFPSPNARTRWKHAGNIINPWIKKVAPDASIHVARATFISYALRDTGGDLMTVMAWAGHANIETTRRYLAAVPRAQKDAIEAVRFP